MKPVLRLHYVPLSAVVDDELPSFPSRPWRALDAFRDYPTLLDGHPCIGVNILLKLLLLGRVGYGTVFWNNWLCDIFARQERLVFFQRERDCFVKRHLFSLLISNRKSLFTQRGAGGGDCLIMLEALLGGHFKANRGIKVFCRAD